MNNCNILQSFHFNTDERSHQNDEANYSTSDIGFLSCFRLFHWWWVDDDSRVLEIYSSSHQRVKNRCLVLNWWVNQSRTLLCCFRSHNWLEPLKSRRRHYLNWVSINICAKKFFLVQFQRLKVNSSEVSLQQTPFEDFFFRVNDFVQLISQLINILRKSHINYINKESMHPFALIFHTT